jgi:hypothetical protein
MAERARAKKSKANGSGKAGHNSGQVPDEVYDRWLAKIDTAEKAADKVKALFDSAKGRLQSVYKAAKEDGCNTTAIKRARKLHREDHAQVTIDYTDTGRVLRILNSPLATQLELFGEIEHPAAVSAWLAGTQAGKSGAPVDDNPHTPGSSVFEEWLSGHKHGVAHAVKSMTPREGASA